MKTKSAKRPTNGRKTKATTRKVAKKRSIEFISKEKFDKLTPEQKRIRIAKDVLLRIEIGNIVPNSGSFCSLPMSVKYDGKNHSLKKLFNRKKEPLPCKACGKGGLFIAWTGINNHFKKHEVGLGGTNASVHSQAMKPLTDIFSRSQLDLIEMAFEGRVFSWTDSEVEASKCGQKAMTKFYQRYDNSKDRLIAIMENIIKNKGTFKP